MTDLGPRPSHSPRHARLVFGLLLGAAFIAMPLLSFHFGITTDEEALNDYGRAIVRFFLSGAPLSGFDSFLTPLLDNSYLKGGLFDALCAALFPLFPGVDEYDLRHVANSLMGFTAVLGAGLLSKRLGGWTAGVLGVGLCLLSPGFFAHCMNNPKDIPFAAFYTLGLFGLVLSSPRWPFFSARAAGLVFFSCVLAANVRLGGLLLLFYAALVLGARCFLARAGIDARKALLLTAVFAALCLAALALGNVFRPWIFADPWPRFWACLSSEIRFDWHDFVLYFGRTVKADYLPWHYLPVWFLLTTPPLVLLALPAGIWTALRRGPRFAGALVLFAAVFPVVFAVARGSIVYDGQRHFLFIYPALVSLAALGWSRVFKRASSLPRPVLRAAPAALFLLLALDPLSFHLRNHPNQLVYFNALAGGTPGAFKRFEMDYWGNSCKQAVDHLRGLARAEGRALRISSVKCPHLVRIYARRFPELVFVGDPEAGCDYSVAFLRAAPWTIDRYLASGDIAHRVTADGVPLCLVWKGKAPPADSPVKTLLREKLGSGWIP